MLPDENDIASETTVNNQRRRAGQLAAADAAVLQDILRTRSGRDFIWRFLERCHLWSTSYHRDSFDATAFSEGERNIGLFLFGEVLRADPNAFLLAQQEHRKKDNARRNDPSGESDASDSDSGSSD